MPILAAATPRAVWLEGDVQSLAEAGLLLGEDVFRHLTGCSHAVLLAVTLGPGVDAQIRRAGVGDIAAGVASDALGLGIGRADGRCRRGGAAPVGRRAGQVSDGRYSPGYGDWPITVQPLVAAALDTARRRASA